MTTAAVERTKKWIEQVVINFNFCPFAKAEFDNQRIRYIPLDEADPAILLESIFEAFVELDSNPEIATTFAIVTHGFADFGNYLDFLDDAQDLLETTGYEGVYQLASFHPAYQFDGNEPDDAGNFTNRSPYPMIHILREDMVEQAIKLHPDTLSIPEKNQRLARTKDVDFWRRFCAELKP